jgi:hypothetical protein
MLTKADLEALAETRLQDAILLHNLKNLLGTAGLKQLFSTDSQADRQLEAAWGIACNWTESSRYELWDSISAGSLIGAIGDPDHGVFQ